MDCGTEYRAGVQIGGRRGQKAMAVVEVVVMDVFPMAVETSGHLGVNLSQLWNWTWTVDHHECKVRVWGRREAEGGPEREAPSLVRYRACRPPWSTGEVASRGTE